MESISNIINLDASAPGKESPIINSKLFVKEVEVEGRVQDDHMMVSGNQRSEVVAWKKSGIKESDANVSSNEDGGDAFPRIACDLLGGELETYK